MAGSSSGGRTHKTAAVVVPPEDVCEAIQAIRRRYDRQFRRWMPHVTLIYPFRPREAFDEVASLLRVACAEMDTFEATLADFRFFEHGPASCTLWLVPEPAERFCALHRILSNAMREITEPPGRTTFTPHLSVGQAPGRAAAMELVERLRMEWRPVRFAVSDVCLIWRNDPPDDVFRVGRRVPLPGAPDSGEKRTR